jgi:hypothetical protein
MTGTAKGQLRFRLLGTLGGLLQEGCVFEVTVRSNSLAQRSVNWPEPSCRIVNRFG